MRGAISPRLMLLLAGGVATTIAGLAIVAYIPAPGVTRADLVDAGIVADTTPRRLSCWATGEACPDGGACQLVTFAAVAKTLNAAGEREVIFPRSAAKLRRHLDSFGESGACRVTALTWGEVSDFGADPAQEEPPCRCQRTAGPPCLDLAGQPIDRTREAAETQGGAGSVNRLCGSPAGNDQIPEACR